MVAAWIRAETGVGPAIASGSHVYNGICALFPIAPTKSKIVISVNVEVSMPMRLRKYLVIFNASEVHEDEDNSQQHPQVADAVHDECFVGCIIVVLILEPESDQQVRAQSNAFPANEHHEVIRAHHQQQHEEHKRFR